MYDGVEVVDGGQVSSKCRRCRCEAGRMVCEQPACDCSDPEVDHDCCKACDQVTQCHHQQLHNVVFRAGEQWLFNCQTCECLVSINPKKYTQKLKHLRR